MRDGYKIIFWGIFISTFHINFGIVQILPVFIGFLIIRLGIKSIVEEYDCTSLHNAVKVAALTAAVSAVGSIIGLVLINFNQYNPIFVCGVGLMIVL